MCKKFFLKFALILGGIFLLALDETYRPLCSVFPYDTFFSGHFHFPVKTHSLFLDQVMDGDSSSLAGEVDTGSSDSQEERRLGQVSTREVTFSRVSTTHLTIIWICPDDFFG